MLCERAVAVVVVAASLCACGGRTDHDRAGSDDADHADPNSVGGSVADNAGMGAAAGQRGGGASGGVEATTAGVVTAGTHDNRGGAEAGEQGSDAPCTQCDGECVDLSSSVAHCGACDRECVATDRENEVSCSAGRCVSTCAAGYANVGRPEAPAADDGCEVNLSTSLDHCGALHRACASAHVRERICEEGLCTSSCEDGWANQSRPAAPAPDDGCELPVATMVCLPEGYCIDSTEVTQSQYQAWLDATPAPSTSEQIAACSWNESFEPDSGCFGGSDVHKGTGWENHPMVCIDWCDAYAYCRGVEKRLCGKIGGGADAYGDYGNAELSQWYNACVSGGANNTYPYGTEYEADACNDRDHGALSTVPVKSMTDCQSTVSGYVGVYDLSGNAKEWEDSCAGHAGQTDHCRHRGCSFDCEDPELDLRCASGGNARRDYANHDIGFRCCAG